MLPHVSPCVIIVMVVLILTTLHVPGFTSPQPAVDVARYTTPEVTTNTCTSCNKTCPGNKHLTHSDILPKNASCFSQSMAPPPGITSGNIVAFNSTCGSVNGTGNLRDGVFFTLVVWVKATCSTSWLVWSFVCYTWVVYNVIWISDLINTIIQLCSRNSKTTSSLTKKADIISTAH